MCSFVSDTYQPFDIIMWQLSNDRRVWSNLCSAYSICNYPASLYMLSLNFIIVCFSFVIAVYILK